MSFPADTIGHHLHMTWPAEQDHRRHAACSGCDWTREAPGSTYTFAREAHTEAHQHLLTEAASDELAVTHDAPPGPAMSGPKSGAGRRRKGNTNELAAARYLAANGFPHAERRGGGFGGSDIVGTPGLTFEVKAQAGARLATWADQTEAARAAAGDTYGVLIAKRAGTTDVGRWHAVLPMAQFMALLAEAGWTAPTAPAQLPGQLTIGD